MNSVDLEVIYLTARGWCVRERGTRRHIVDHVPTQALAIEAARLEALSRIGAGVRSVEVRIKTKWLKRIRDSRTYGYDNPSIPG